MTGPVQLLVYRFGERAAYEGRLVGALERMESGGTLRIVEALFITHDADTGELAAIDLRSRGAGSLVSPLIGFRLDESERRRATQRALRADGEAEGVSLRDIGAALAPGAAIAAVLVEHTWARALEGAVTDSGGTAVASEFVNAATLADVAPRLRAAAAAA
jgi:hypothetical protein